jgi:1,4-dihydroxy-2-naphthoate polyprenyltransferase
MKAIFQHLRFPFSFLLMPVFWFSLMALDYHGKLWQDINLMLLFFVLHVLVYPSSNAFNSTQDHDEGSVGLIKNPLPVPTQLTNITIGFDVLAILLSCFINMNTACLIVCYIIASRLYSWRKVRLKQYPIIGFITVFICQGALIFFIVKEAIGFNFSLYSSIYIFFIDAFAASLMIGAMYPLSQIYQHKQDEKDGVKTISAWLSYRGTFIFSALQFLLFGALTYFIIITNEYPSKLIFFLACQLPIMLFFLYWFYQVEKNKSNANYSYTMRMNMLSSCCMNICFSTLCFWL